MSTLKRKQYILLDLVMRDIQNHFHFKHHVTSQFLCNVSDVTLVPNFGRILVASLSNVKCSVMLWSDNRNIMDYWMFCSLQGTVLNMFSSVFNVVKYNSDGVL